MMRSVCLVLLVTINIYITNAEDDSNELLPDRPPISLDSSLRRALLKALTELENEEQSKRENEQINSMYNLPDLSNDDKLIEKAPASALTFFASNGNDYITEAEVTTTSTILVQKSNGQQSKSITTFEKQELDPINDAEQFLTSASNGIAPQQLSFSKIDTPRSIISNGASANSLLNDVKEITKSSRTKIETTTPLITTTTEESQAKVEDVQFFSAPLVAAFTVHQDETGLPKSVVPIYKPKTKLVEVGPTQIALEQKQKLLEEELQKLKENHQRQNYFIQQQQFLRLQNQKQFEEQLKLRNNNQEFAPLINSARNTGTANNFQALQTNNFAIKPTNSFGAGSRSKGTVVSFQPSITFPSTEQLVLFQNGQLPINAQILPIKSAENFRSPFKNHNGFGIQQQLPSKYNLQNFNNILPPQITLTAPNRFNRQESNTGNFLNTGFNSANNNGNFNFNQTPLQPQNTRFFRSNAEGTLTQPLNNFNAVQPPVFNYQLNNLLHNSGVIKGRQQEDLNIISKVILLNHRSNNDYRFNPNSNQQQFNLRSQSAFQQ